VSLPRELLNAVMDYSKALVTLDEKHPNAHASRKRIYEAAELTIEQVLAKHNLKTKDEDVASPPTSTD